MAKYRLYDIVWDVDEEDEALNLPRTETLDIEGSGLENLTEDELAEYGFADWLSDRFGMCVNTFNFEKIEASE